MAADLERKRARNREWIRANPDKARAARRVSIESRARYRQTHRDELRAKARAYAARDPERHRARVKAWKKRNPTKVAEYNRRHVLKRDYGLSPDEFAAMSKAQDDRCAICRRKVELVVDHDHETGCVRALLCHSCNRVLGVVRDDPVQLLAMVRYLETMRCQ